MRIALAQTNPTVGDVDGNTAEIVQFIDEARADGATVVVFPELAVLGYPPRDLLYRPNLIRRNCAAVEEIAAQCRGITAVVGFVQPDSSGAGNGLFNAAAVCRDGKIDATYAKMLLPNYDVFDEMRYFNSGADALTFPSSKANQDHRTGVTICEDLWNDHQFVGRVVYRVDPVAMCVAAGANVLLNLSASPYRTGIPEFRETLFSKQIIQHGVPLVFVSQVGGNDDLVFDGASAVFDAQGNVVARAKSFATDLLVVDLDHPEDARIEALPTSVEGLRRALVLGTRDYLRKCGFERALVGISGGIDSALTAALAVEALGADNVHGVALPSRYSSDHSLEDAKKLARNLGIRLSNIPIEGMHAAGEAAVAPWFAEYASGEVGVAEENLQARIRGNVLMSLANKSGALLLSTGNKSEHAVGYCTLYGDMCGGLAVLSDVPKTTVYQLSRWMNESAGRTLIPERTISKPASAELRADQCDQDTLPQYDTLDAILDSYVVHDRSIEEIVSNGFDRDVVERVVGMVNRSEHKRKQAPVGLRVSGRAFGTGRRMPIAARGY